MKHLLTYLLILLCLLGNGQSRIDSMRQKAYSLEPDTSKVLTYIRLAIAYNRINYDSALRYANKAEQLSRELGLEEFLGRSKYRMATTYIQMNKLELAETELDTAIRMLESSGNKQQLMGAKIGLARMFQKRSDFDQAVIRYFEALRLAEEIRDRNAEARVKNYLAAIYNYQKQYDLAITYFQEALKLVEQLNFKPGISAVLTNLGDVYLTVEKYDSAIIYQRKALQLKQGLGDRLGMARVFNNLANVFVNSGSDLDSGIYYYNRGLDIGTDLEDRQLIALSLYGLVRTNFIKGSFGSAKRKGDELLQELDSINDLSLATNSYDQVSLVYAALGEVEKSLEFRSISKVLSDSLLSRGRIQLTNELDAKYQSEAKQRAIELLESDNRLQELQINKRRNERNGLIVLSLVIMLMLVLLVNQYRIKQKANKQLKELDQIKSTFFENLSHEFRTPLSLIIAPIKDRLKNTSGKEEDEILKMVLRNAENLDELIKQLLDLAKLEKGKFELKNKVIEVTQLFKIITASYESLAMMKGIDFNSTIPNQELWLEIDEDLVKKICNNLLSNAFKFTPDNGIVNFNVTHDESLDISVSDSGPGIPKEDQHRIFDRFYQVDGPNSYGTGIGLALTKELVEAASGKIALESSPGNGSNFLVSLPMKRTEVRFHHQAEIAIPSDQEGIVDPSFSPEKQNLLIIEDNLDLRSYLSGLFTQDYNVYTAINGQEGVNEAMETIPDLIISDIMMDEMDGLEVCQQLKSDQKTDHIPIILLTARSDQQTKLSGIKHGADAYLLKPFESDELKAIAQNLIEQRQRLRDKYADEEELKTNEPQIHPLIKKAEEIVLNQLSNESFTVDDFAHEVGMSRMQLHRKLKAMTGLSATAFVRHHRLNRAKKLLEEGEAVSQVAYAVGFSSLAYFTKSFKEQFGSVPSHIGKTVDQPFD